MCARDSVPCACHHTRDNNRLSLCLTEHRGAPLNTAAFSYLCLIHKHRHRRGRARAALRLLVHVQSAYLTEVAAALGPQVMARASAAAPRGRGGYAVRRAPLPFTVLWGARGADLRAPTSLPRAAGAVADG